MMRLPLTTFFAAILLNLLSGFLYSDAEVRSARSQNPPPTFSATAADPSATRRVSASERPRSRWIKGSLPSLLNPLTTPLMNDKAPLTSAKQRIERLRHLLTLYEPLLKELSVEEQIKMIQLFAQTHLLLAELIRDLPPRLTAGEPYYEHFYLHQENLSLPLLDKTADLSRRIVEIAKKSPSDGKDALWAREFLKNHEEKHR